jgi:hypothetical protein
VEPNTPECFSNAPVNNNRDVGSHKGSVFISEVFRNEEIGFEPMDDNVYRVFCNIKLGEFNSSEMRLWPEPRIQWALHRKSKWLHLVRSKDKARRGGRPNCYGGTRVISRFRSRNWPSVITHLICGG